MSDTEFHTNVQKMMHKVTNLDKVQVEITHSSANVVSKVLFLGSFFRWSVTA